MLQVRALTLAQLVIFPILGLSAESLRDIEGPESVEISTADREALLAAPRTFMRPPPSVALNEAIHAGTIEKIEVERFIERFEEGDNRSRITTYFGWIRYAPVVQSNSRILQPEILCVSQWGVKINWTHCQDESWVRLQTADMANAIRINGELDDEQIAQIFDHIGNAALISTDTDQPLTSDDICQMTNNASRWGPTTRRAVYAFIDVYMKTSKDACRMDVINRAKTNVIHVTFTRDPAEQTAFEISEVEWVPD